MKSMSFKKASLSFLVLTSLMLTHIPAARANNELGVATTSTLLTNKKVMLITAAVALALCVIKFNSTEPHNNPVRYDLDKLLEDLKTGNITRETWENFKYLIIDGLVGHPGKRPSQRIDETGRIYAHPGAFPKGIGGYINGYMRPVAITATFTILFAKYLKEFFEGIDAWKLALNGDWGQLKNIATDYKQ